MLIKSGDLMVAREEKNIQKNCTQYNGDEEKRRHITFPVFTGSTDEKNQTIKVVEGFLDGYLLAITKKMKLNNSDTKPLEYCQIADLGSGDGKLSIKFANYMSAACQNIKYEAIDSEEELVDATKNELHKGGFNNETTIVYNGPRILDNKIR